MIDSSPGVCRIGNVKTALIQHEHKQRAVAGKEHVLVAVEHERLGGRLQ
jgi:hypothetical protein